jgi:transposase
LPERIGFEPLRPVDARFAQQWRRIATRYDKLAKTFTAFVKVASLMLWL